MNFSQEIWSGPQNAHFSPNLDSPEPNRTNQSRKHERIKTRKRTRTYLKNVFWPHIFVGASFQILDNQQVACGFKLGPAAIWNQNPIFEMASNINFVLSCFRVFVVRKVFS